MRAFHPDHRLSLVLVGLLAGIFECSVRAQAAVARNEVIGITRATGPANPRLLRQRTDFAACVTNSCAVLGFEKGGKAWAGGAAFNGDVPPNLTRSLGGVWISNGKTIAQVDPFGCGFKCAPQAAPLVSSASEVTGLAYWEAAAALLMSDSANLLYWVSPTGCTLSAVACDFWQKTVVPAGYTIGGLATDDVNRRLFVSASNFGSPAVVNRIWVANLGFPSRPIRPGWCATTVCSLNVPVCSGTRLGPITGLGFDACTSTLYYTDGATVVAARIVYDVAQRTCRATLIGCCKNSTGDPYTGLCVVQRPTVAVGKSCVEAPCIACPTMTAGSYGAAFLGNRNFAITLRNAPTGSMPVFLAIAVGACSPVGLNIGFCEPARIGLRLPPMVIPVRVAKTGATPCDGHATISIGVPPIPAFCGFPLSAQFAMHCPGSPSGTGKAISNCVTFEVTSN